MKTWTFTFSTTAFVDENGYSHGADWGWNSVQARGVKSAIKKATKWCKEYGEVDHRATLDVGSLNCEPSVEKRLLADFW